MFGENASFIKTVEIDDSVFQCNPECAEKYLLQLEWSRDNEAWQWRVLKKSDVLTPSNSNNSAATNNAAPAGLSAEDEQRIADLEGLVESLQSQLEALQQSSAESSTEDPEGPSNDVEPDPEEPGL